MIIDNNNKRSHEWRIDWGIGFEHRFKNSFASSFIRYHAKKW